MGYLANRFTVLLDANVLYPARKRDLLLSFGEEGLCRIRWTKDIEHEWTQRLAEAFPDKQERILHLAEKMNSAFPEAEVADYVGLATSVLLPDPDDRHVVAAAVRCGAQIIVTDNLKHFPAAALLPLDLEALSADQFLTTTFDLFPYEGLEAVRRVRSRLHNPPYAPNEFIMDLTAKGMPLLASSLREKQKFI